MDTEDQSRTPIITKMPYITTRPIQPVHAVDDPDIAAQHRRHAWTFGASAAASIACSGARDPGDAGLGRQQVVAHLDHHVRQAARRGMARSVWVTPSAAE